MSSLLSNKCLVCGSDGEVYGDGGSYYRFVECYVCGRFAINEYMYQPNAKDMNKLSHYLYYNRIPLEARGQADVIHYNVLGSIEKCKELAENGTNYFHVTDDIVENWYPKTFSAKIDMILLGLSKQARFLGDSVKLTKPQTIAALFVNFIDEHGAQMQNKEIINQASSIVKYLQDNEYTERVNLEAPCFVLKVSALERVDKLKNEKASNVINLTNSTDKQVYNNFLNVLSVANIDDVEKLHLSEACMCANNDLILSAMTMLGCAAECLLLQLCNAYLSYLENGHGTEREIENFKTNAVNAKKASARLDVFQKTVQNKESLFESLGLERVNSHLAFFDLLRQVRNEAGHPTGIIVSSEIMNTYFTNYQLLFDRIHKAIEKLPLLQP